MIIVTKKLSLILIFEWKWFFFMLKFDDKKGIRNCE